MIDSLTPTQRCIFETLGDRQPHSRKELHDCLPDNLGSYANLNRHLSDIRKKLPKGEEIICVLHNRRICYRYIGTIASIVT